MPRKSARASVAINKTSDGSDPTRGSGDEKVTEAVQPGFDAPPGALENEPDDSNAADPARVGCLKLGWGCLPLILIVTVMPAGLLF